MFNLRRFAALFFLQSFAHAMHSREEEHRLFGFFFHLPRSHPVLRLQIITIDRLPLSLSVYFYRDCEQGNAFSLSKMEKLKERRVTISSIVIGLSPYE